MTSAMTKTMLKIGAATTVGLMMTGCAITGDRTADAAITGAGGGAVAGEVLTNDPVAGAAIGGAAGAIAAEVSDDDDDR